MSDTTAPDASQHLDAISDRYWDLLLERSPTWATDLGDRRFDDRLQDLSLELRATFFAACRTLKADLVRIPADGLSGQHAITHEVLHTLLDLEIENEAFVDEQWTINPLTGPLFGVTELAERQPVVPRESLHKLVSRFQQVPRLMSQVMDHLRTGIAQGRTAPRMGPERMAAQIRRMLEISPETSAFMPPEVLASSIGAEAYGSIRDELAGVVSRHVYPALAAYGDFLEQTYLPSARVQPGLCAMPDGEAYYQFLIRLYTGSALTAQQIHQIGREELARIHEEMRAIGVDVFGDPDIRNLAERLRSQSDQYLPDRDSLLDHNRALLERAEAALPGYFSRLPARRCEVRAIEPFREMDSPSGYYCHAPDDGSRPAYYYVNTSRPDHRPLYNMEALAFHEAMPGHHLQIAIAQDLEGLPAFRRHTGQTAYIEGWALYSERLSDEMGLYSSRLTRFGMLNYQAWRAARLVIDTGIHALGWSREQAVKEMLHCTAHTEPEAVVEVDRYISMPGQALAYMLGRISIDELRATARERLGNRFDLKEFHSRVLENGAVPLASLRHLIGRWLDASAEA